MSTAATVALGIPWFLASLGIVWSLTAFGPWGWVIFVGWLLSGAAMMWRRSEDVLVRVFGGLHRPMHDEQRRLVAAWGAVTLAAGIERTRYSLWVQESEDINAIAAGGHTVAVTRKALETLPPGKLEAVLAHELGHHLGGHAWAVLLMHWYSLPSRVTLRVVLYLGFHLVQPVRWVVVTAYRLPLMVYHVASRVVPIFVPSSQEAMLVTLLIGGSMRIIAGMMAITAIIFMIHVALWLALLSLVVSIVAVALAMILSWFSRLGEKYADQVAARLGYGPALIEVLQDWRAKGPDSSGAKLGLLARLLSSHPALPDRIRALERYLQRNEAGT